MSMKIRWIVGIGLAALALPAIPQSATWRRVEVPKTGLSLELPGTLERASDVGETAQYQGKFGSIGVLAVVTTPAEKSKATLATVKANLEKMMNYKTGDGNVCRLESLKAVTWRGKKVLRGSAVFKSPTGSQLIRIFAYADGRKTMFLNIGYPSGSQSDYKTASRIDQSVRIR